MTFGDAKADACRRDFTMNGLFYDPVRGQLHDWVGGEADVRSRLVRTIGDPAERFAEDHLRLLRAVRFAARLDFEIEGGTFAALRAHAALIKTISAERIRDELIKLLQPPETPGSPDNRNPASRGLELLSESGLLDVVLPEVAATRDCSQSPDFHPEGSVFNHLLLMLGQMLPGAGPVAAVGGFDARHRQAGDGVEAMRGPAASIFTGTKKSARRWPSRFWAGCGFRGSTSRRWSRCGITCNSRMRRRCGRSTLRRLLLRETFPLELELHRLDCLGSHGRLELYDFLVEQARELEKQPEIRPPLLTGDDLMALGMKPGPAMGELLADIREKQLQEELTTAAEARRWVKQTMK